MAMSPQTTGSNAAPVDLQVAPRELDDMGRIPDVSETMDQAFVRDVRRFMDEVVGALKRELESYETLREGEDFTKRQDMNERRTRLKLDQRFDVNGNLDPLYKDGHAELGLLLGWTKQGVKNGVANLRKNLLELSKRPYMVTARGEGQENSAKEKMVYGVLDDMMRRGELRQRMGYVTNLVPFQGTAVLRYEMGRSSDWTRDAKGNWMEADPRALPRLTVWPLDQVYVSNPDRPEAADQDGVFWLTRNMTLAGLEEDEIVTVGGKEAGGKFRNLESVRKFVEEYMGNSSQTGGTFFPRATLVEYEGPLPLTYWVKQGFLTYRIAKFFGVDVGMDPNPSDPEAVREWARRLSRITHWRVAYLRDWTGGKGSSASGGQTILQIAPIAAGRNSLYRFPWLQDGLRFYASSVADLGCRLEAAADCINNADLYVSHMNAHPPKAINERAFEMGQTEEVEKQLATPDGTIKIAQNQNVKDAVQLFFREHDALVAQKIANFKMEFEFTTGVSAAAKGNDQARATGTLGEIQINETKSDLEMMTILLDCGAEICRLAKDILEDTLSAMKVSLPAEAQAAGMDEAATWKAEMKTFVDYAARVSGLSPSEIEEVLPSVDGLLEEIEFRPPFAAGNDRAVLAQVMMNLFTLTQGAAFGDVAGFAKDVLEVYGFSRAEEVTRSYAGMDPDNENRMLSQGTWVAPDPKEDLAKHLMAHGAALNEIQQRAKTGQERPEDETAAVQLGQHVARTLELIGLQIQLMQAAAQMGAGGAGPGAGAAPAQGPAATVRPGNLQDRRVEQPKTKGETPVSSGRGLPAERPGTTIRGAQ